MCQISHSRSIIVVSAYLCPRYSLSPFQGLSDANATAIRFQMRDGVDGFVVRIESWREQKDGGDAPRDVGDLARLLARQRSAEDVVLAVAVAEESLN